jgi:hypothetical protein
MVTSSQCGASAEVSAFVLASAEALERPASGELPDIQATAGLGNLTKSVFDLATEHEEIEETLLVLFGWEDVATSKWPLSYRRDKRNWRLSNRREYPERKRGD